MVAASDGQKVQRMLSAQEGLEPLAVAGDVIFRETVRDRRRHGEIDEGDERQRLHRGVIDRDLVRRMRNCLSTSTST